MLLTVIRICGKDFAIIKDGVPPMYVCICNALREKELQAAAADPAVKGVSCVFKRCSSKPQCGRCLPDVADMIAANRIGPDDLAAAAE